MTFPRYIASDPSLADRREDFPADDWQDDPDDWSPLQNLWCEIHQKNHQPGGLTCEMISQEAWDA